MVSIGYFKGVLVGRLDSLGGNRQGMRGVFEAVEKQMADAGYEPWHVYAPFITDDRIDPQYRGSALGRLHDPALVPEGEAAYSVSGSAIHAMKEGKGMASNAFMAAGIFRSYDPLVMMLPLDKATVDGYFIPFARDRPQQPPAALTHILHTVPAVTALSAAHSGAYNDVLADQLGALPEVRSLALSEMEPERVFGYGDLHVTEHLSHALYLAAKAGDKTLRKLLDDRGALTILSGIDERINAPGVSVSERDKERIKGYMEQRDEFLRVL